MIDHCFRITDRGYRFLSGEIKYDDLSLFDVLLLSRFRYHNIQLLTDLFRFISNINNISINHYNNFNEYYNINNIQNTTQVLLVNGYISLVE